MKIFVKLTSLMMALLMLVTAFAACGGGKETTAEPDETKAPVTKEETGRFAVYDDLPEDFKTTGDVTLLVRTSNENELACEELMNDTLLDAIHYRNIDLEQQTGAKIVTIAQPCGWDGTIELWNQTLSTSVLTNTGDFDGAAIYTSQGSPLAKEGVYYNVMNLTTDFGGHFDLSKPYWNQTLVDELTVYGSLFFLAGDLLISEAQQGVCLFFNKDLFNEKNPTEGINSLYQSVRDQGWTIEKLTDYVSGVWDDANSNGVIDDGDVMGWSGLGGNDDGDMDAWIYSLGLNLTTMNQWGEPEISIIYDPNTIPAYELVKKLYTGNPGAYGSSGLTAKATESTMQNGNVLFARQNLGSGASMRDSNVNFGVLPLPKLNEEQEDYRVMFVNNASMLVLCSNLSEERAIALSGVFERMSSLTYRNVTPVYYETVLQGQYSKDAPDAEMYELILSKFVADFGFVYSNKSINQIGSLFRTVDAGFDISSKIEGSKTAYETALAALLEALEAVSE